MGRTIPTANRYIGATVHDLTRADIVAFGAYLVPLVVLMIFSYLVLSPALPVAQYLWGLVR